VCIHNVRATCSLCVKLTRTYRMIIAMLEHHFVNNGSTVNWFDIIVYSRHAFVTLFSCFFFWCSVALHHSLIDKKTAEDRLPLQFGFPSQGSGAVVQMRSRQSMWKVQWEVSRSWGKEQHASRGKARVAHESLRQHPSRPRSEPHTTHPHRSMAISPASS
jgi:hypothetical protein